MYYDIFKTPAIPCSPLKYMSGNLSGSYKKTLGIKGHFNQVLSFFLVSLKPLNKSHISNNSGRISPGTPTEITTGMAFTYLFAMN